MNKNQKQKQGLVRAFSLVELLVVIGIIGILATILIVSLSSGKSKKEVEDGALRVAAKIREAQTAALTGKQHIVNTTPCAYRVAWGGSQITLSYMVKSGGSCVLNSTVDATTLPPGVLFSGTGSADFVLPHGEVAESQVLTLQKGDYSWVVCLRDNGLIEAEASADSCSL